jgi:fluoroacetyl-CoA thioesterase
VKGWLTRGDWRETRRICRKLAEPLEDGWATVGVEVCVKHVAAAPEGATCTVTARLREVEDGRKLRFDVEVRDGERTIGVGTHERRVIERSNFG